MSGGYAPGAGPDAQRRHLLDAARSVEAFTDLHPPADGPEGELAAKALHLAACVAAVDFMCRRGDLPGDWRAGGESAATAEGPALSFACGCRHEGWYDPKCACCNRRSDKSAATTEGA